MKKIVLASLLSALFCTFLFAEDKDNATNEPAVAPTSSINLRPQFRGTLRVRGEHRFDENLNRFNIPNARAAVFGNVTEWASYQMQVDLNSHGQFRFLDMEARFRENRNFSFRVGQMLVPFTQLQQIVPRMVALCELPWVVSRMGGSLRDVGVNATYRFRINDFPIALTGGIYNGEGIGNPIIWTNNFAHSFRLMFGAMEGVRASLKTYHNEQHEIYGVDFRFFRNGFTVDAEVLRGNYIRADETIRKIGSLLHVAQMFNTGRETIRYVEPIVRWDMMGLANSENFSDANRLTFGINFGFREFNQRQFFRTGELRLNYAHVFVNDARAPIYFGANPALWSNKLILEFTLEI